MECPSCGTPRQGRERVCRECGARLADRSLTAVIAAIAIVLVGGWYLVAQGEDSIGGVDGSIELPNTAEGTFSPPPTTPPPPMVEPAGACAGTGQGANVDCPVWSVKATTAAAPFGTPVIDEGRLYVGTRQGLVALDMTTGGILWSYRGGALDKPPALSNRGVLYIVDDSGTVAALNRADGRVHWSVHLNTPAVAAPIFLNQTVVIATQGRIRGLSASHGSQQWELAVHGAPSQPVQENWTRFVVGDGNGDVRSIDVNTGAVRWRRQVDGWEVAVSEQPPTILSTGFGGHLTALDPETGETRWASDLLVGWSTPHVHEDRVFVVVDVFDEGEPPVAELWRFDIGTGEARRIRSFPSARDVLQLEVGPAGLVHVWHVDTGLIVLDQDGAALWDGGSQDIRAVTTGWNDQRPWMAVIDRNGSRLAVLPSPRRHLVPEPEAMKSGQACQPTPIQKRSYGTVAAGGVYEVSGLGTEHAGILEATLLFDLDDMAPPLFISGRRLDGPGVMGFQTSLADEPVSELELSTGQRGAVGFPPHWGLVVSVPSPGCWAYQIDGPLGVDHIVVEITPEDFAQLPPFERQAPADHAGGS